MCNDKLETFGSVGVAMQLHVTDQRPAKARIVNYTYSSLLPFFHCSTCTRLTTVTVSEEYTVQVSYQNSYGCGSGMTCYRYIILMQKLLQNVVSPSMLTFTIIQSSQHWLQITTSISHTNRVSSGAWLL